MTIPEIQELPQRNDPLFNDKAMVTFAGINPAIRAMNETAGAMSLNALSSTSSTSLSVSVASKSLTVEAGKSYLPGQSVKIARTYSPTTWMHGDVVSYNNGTGALVVNVTNILGTGTHSDWTITFSAPIWSPADGSITRAKLENFSTTKLLIGRNSAATGPPEEVTLSQVLDWIGSATRGDLLFRGEDDWERFPAATTGKFLKTNGVATPEWADVASPQGAARNLVASATGTSAAITITADEITVHNGTLSRTIRPVSLSISGSTSGVNGLDTGTIAANTWYSTWCIYHPASNLIAGLLSLSATAPTLPSGYTFKARTGWIRTDSSGNAYPLSFTRRDSKVQPKVVTGSNVANYPVMASGVAGSTTTPTYVGVAVSSFVSPSATSIKIAVRTEGEVAQCIVSPNNATGSGSSLTNPPMLCVDGYFIGESTGPDGRLVNVDMLLESTSIYWASNDSDSRMYCLGWEDNL